MVKKDGTGEFGELEAEMNELTTIYTKEVRNKKIRWYIVWLLVNVALCAYILLLNAIYWQAWGVDCIKRLSVWLMVYNIL